MEKIFNSQTNKPRTPKLSGCGVLLFNGAGELLIAKSPYKDYWTVPGGGIEANESPSAGCIRETKEEVNIDLTHPVLISVEYQNFSGKKEIYRFLFHGGILTAGQLERIKLQKDEISEIRFVPVAEALGLLGKPLAVRIPECLEAYKDSRILYFEDIRQTVD